MLRNSCDSSWQTFDFMMAELDLSKGLNLFLPYTGRPKRKGEKITLYCDGKQKTTLKVPN